MTKKRWPLITYNHIITDNYIITYIHIHICSYMYIYVHICTYMFIYVHICSYMYIYAYVYLFTDVYIYNIYVYCIRIKACIHIKICLQCYVTMHFLTRMQIQSCTCRASWAACCIPSRKVCACDAMLGVIGQALKPVIPGYNR